MFSASQEASQSRALNISVARAAVGVPASPRAVKNFSGLIYRKNV